MTSSHSRKLELEIWNITDEGCEDDVLYDSPTWQLIEQSVKELRSSMKIMLSASDGLDLSLSRGIGLSLDSDDGGGPLMTNSLDMPELITRFHLFFEGKIQELIDLDWDIIGYGRWDVVTGDILVGQTKSAEQAMGGNADPRPT